MMKVGWIGLGSIGEAFALKILSEGHELIGHSRGGRPREALTAAGARLSGSLQEVVSEVDVVGVGLFSDNQLGEVFTRALFDAMRPGTVVAVHTTGTPTFIEDLAAKAPPHVTVLDATFSGRKLNAQAGDVRLFIGGDAGALEKARPVFQAFCNPILHFGEVGAARRFKLINNLIFAAQLNLAAEGLTAMTKMGLPLEMAIEGLSISSGGSFALNTLKGGDLAGLDKQHGHYMHKDVNASRDLALAEGLQLPLLDAAAARWSLPRS